MAGFECLHPFFESIDMAAEVTFECLDAALDLLRGALRGHHRTALTHKRTQTAPGRVHGAHEVMHKLLQMIVHRHDLAEPLRDVLAPPCLAVALIAPTGSSAVKVRYVELYAVIRACCFLPRGPVQRRIQGPTDIGAQACLFLVAHLEQGGSDPRLPS